MTGGLLRLQFGSRDAFVYETDATRARGRILAANHYLRKLGASPQPAGANPGADNAKSLVMKVVVPVRRRIVRNLDRVRRSREMERNFDAGTP
ncbi:hypothetical protein [Paraburkholderia dinghuensis]|uniref:Uncharacterized protein n=1 Tax=Paraburkholderia dinghuensis TaxID=2305225 RepID=A0A3N6PQK4_9BURK|nr:hypothetical protein [Paraburkholderia dinghuensis]RQH04130.1 hypothetical protein D1Y85_18715 [Paraburkholderia dinghuensis]